MSTRTTVSIALLIVFTALLVTGIYLALHLRYQPTCFPTPDMSVFCGPSRWVMLP